MMSTRRSIVRMPAIQYALWAESVARSRSSRTMLLIIKAAPFALLSCSNFGRVRFEYTNAKCALIAILRSAWMLLYARYIGSLNVLMICTAQSEDRFTYMFAKCHIFVRVRISFRFSCNVIKGTYGHIPSGFCAAIMNDISRLFIIKPAAKPNVETKRSNTNKITYSIPFSNHSTILNRVTDASSFREQCQHPFYLLYALSSQFWVDDL